MERSELRRKLLRSASKVSALGGIVLMGLVASNLWFDYLMDIGIGCRWALLLAAVAIMAAVRWVAGRIRLPVRRQAQRTHDEVAARILERVEAGEAPRFFLFLRPFRALETDRFENPFRVGDDENEDPRLNLAELVRRALEHDAPCVVVGEGRETPGPGIVKCDERRWPETVERLAHAAAWIVVVPWSSPGLLLEARRLRHSSELLDKTLFIAPPLVSAEECRAWSKVRKSWDSLGLPLPPLRMHRGAVVGRVFQQTPEGEVHTVGFFSTPGDLSKTLKAVVADAQHQDAKRVGKDVSEDLAERWVSGRWLVLPWLPLRKVFLIPRLAVLVGLLGVFGWFVAFCGFSSGLLPRNWIVCEWAPGLCPSLELAFSLFDPRGLERVPWSFGTDDAPSGEAIGRLGGLERRRLSVGRYSVCRIDAQGDASCWGCVNPNAGRSLYEGTRDHYGDKSGACHPPRKRWLSLSAGTGFGCGVTSLGTTRCWGRDDEGQTTVPWGRLAAVSVGHGFSCGITADDALRCWGLGARDENEWWNRGRPCHPDESWGPFVDVTVGMGDACALHRGGDAVCWRCLAGEQSSARAYTVLGPFSLMDGSFEHGCGLAKEGLRCWRDEGRQQTTLAVDGPISDLAVSGRSVCLLSDDGVVSCSRGLHTGLGPSAPRRVEVASFTEAEGANEHFVEVDMTTTFACALSDRDRVWCWRLDGKDGGVGEVELQEKMRDLAWDKRMPWER